MKRIISKIKKLLHMPECIIFDLKYYDLHIHWGKLKTVEIEKDANATHQIFLGNWQIVNSNYLYFIINISPLKLIESFSCLKNSKLQIQDLHAFSEESEKIKKAFAYCQNMYNCMALGNLSKYKIKKNKLYCWGNS